MSSRISDALSKYVSPISSSNRQAAVATGRDKESPTQKDFQLSKDHKNLEEQQQESATQEESPKVDSLLETEVQQKAEEDVDPGPNTEPDVKDNSTPSDILIFKLFEVFKGHHKRLLHLNGEKEYQKISQNRGNFLRKGIMYNKRAG